MTRTEVEKLESMLEGRTQVVKEGQERLRRAFAALDQLALVIREHVKNDAVYENAMATITEAHKCVYKNHAGVFEYGCDQCDPEQEDWRDYE